MPKKKNQNSNQKLAKKSAIESLRFQTRYGLKMMGRADDDIFQKLAKTEVNIIAELDLTHDMLDLKSLVDGVKRDLQATPAPAKGDFCTSITAIALGIASIPVLDKMQIPESWHDLINKKTLTIYYPEEYRNTVVCWAKANGFTTSTYLGRPIVKFNQIYVIIERTRT